LNERFPDREKIRIVDSEHLNRDTPNRRFASQCCSCPLEMVAPSVGAWMEKPHDLASVRICSSNVRTLVPIAVKTREGKIFENRPSSVLARHDMIDVKWQRIYGGRKGDNTRTGLARAAGLSGQPPGSRVRAIEGFPLESKPGAGLHDRQQISDMQVAVKLRLLFSRQGSSLRPFRQVQHSLAVAFAEIDRQQEFSGLGRQFVLLRLHQSGPNGRFGI